MQQPDLDMFFAPAPSSRVEPPAHAAPVAQTAPGGLIGPVGGVGPVGESAPVPKPGPARPDRTVGAPLTAVPGGGATSVNAAVPSVVPAPLAAVPAVARSAADTSGDSLVLTDLLTQVVHISGSDLHLSVGSPPVIRRNGHLVVLDDRPVLSAAGIHKMVYAVLTQRQREIFEANLELDFAYAVPGLSRFRVNLYRQRDSLGAAFRLIPHEVRPLESLGLPASVTSFAALPRGFVLVTGPTGSGKSTTMASLLDLVNRTRRDHIMTVEDPIEFLHKHKSCLVNQREVGQDTHSFASALKHVLRQDPDVILVGEMRDLETISVALTAAETGHLVFATLHTQDAAQSIDRVIDVFPPSQQQQVRVQLGGALQGIVSQQLCRSADGNGRVLAAEVLVGTPAIRNLIREGKTHQVYSALQAGAAHGMSTMDQHLAGLVRAGRVAYDLAAEKCHHKADLDRLLGRG